jgi:hypothetical protein
MVHAGRPASAGAVTEPWLEPKLHACTRLAPFCEHALGHAIEIGFVCVPDDVPCFEHVQVAAGHEQLMSNSVPSLHVPAELTSHPASPPLLPPPIS